MAQVYFWGGHTKASRGWKQQGREQTILNCPSASGMRDKTFLFLICWDCGMKPSLLCAIRPESFDITLILCLVNCRSHCAFPFLLACWRAALCRQMSLPNCIAFSYRIFLRAFLCTENISKGIESLQTSSLHSSNYGNSAVNVQNNHSGSTRTHSLGELCFMCFKQGSLGSCYQLQLWAAVIYFALAERGIQHQSAAVLLAEITVCPVRQY